MMADRATKLELILAGKRAKLTRTSTFLLSCIDEDRIRDITKNLSEIDTLARVLDREHFQGTPDALTLLPRKSPS